MKSLICFFLLFGSVLFFPQSFHSLDGIESSQGETILLYRLGSSYFPNNPVYKLNTSTLFEQLVMDAFYYHSNGQARGIWDFEFFPGDDINFMNSGDEINPDNHSFIARNDSNVFGGFGSFFAVDISNQNPLKVFAFDGSICRSFDGGFSFPIDSIVLPVNFIPVALSDHDDNLFFGYNEDKYFSKNGETVDTSAVFFDEYFNLKFDVNQLHIYRVNKTYGGYTLNVSSNLGNPFSWSKTFESSNPLFISTDTLSSGVVYLSDKNRILKSTNYGYSFSEFKKLPYRINGIYKKPGEEILYASTSYKIFRITPAEVSIIKSLPVPQEVFSYYPLDTGNKWVFDEYTIVYNWPWEYYHYIITKEVLGDSTAVNGKTYKFIKDQTHPELYLLERIDSTEGKIYRFTDDSGYPGQEYLVEDLLAEPGDTVVSCRYGYQTPPDAITIVLEEEVFQKWGLTKPKKVYYQENLFWPYYSLTMDIGLDSLNFGFDFGSTNIILKGCVLNGVVYGDTTLTDVNDYSKLLPDDFQLYQNYPNPFNPVTTIRYALKNRQFVTLKIFDVLGNEIAVPVNQEKEAGVYEFYWNAGNLPSGIYYYRIQSGSFIETRKMILLK